MSAPLQILFPNGQVEAVQVYIWDVNTLQPVVWTGAVTGGGGGGGAVTIANGADVSEGSTTDALVIGDLNGTIQARIRGLSQILNSVWSGGGDSETLAVIPTGGNTTITNFPTNFALETGGNLAALNAKFNSLAQKTAALSAPVVLSSDQMPLIGVLSDGIGNPSTGGIASFLLGWDSNLGQWKRVSVNDNGQLVIASNVGVNLAQVNGAAIGLGQNTSANSLPVVIASNQSTIPVSVLTVPLPSGAASQPLVSGGLTSYIPGATQPLSLTVDGRLRTAPDTDRVDYFPQPFDLDAENPWEISDPWRQLGVN